MAVTGYSERSPWKVKGGNVVGRDLVVLDHGGVCRDRVPVARENGRACCRSREILMTVADSLYDPRGLHVDEDRVIVRAMGGLEHANHVQLEWVDAREIKHALRRGYDRVPRTHPQQLRQRRAQYALAEECHRTPRCDAQASKVEVLECCSDDRVAAGAEADVQRDRFRQARVGDALDLGEVARWRWLGLEVERVQHELERTALGTDQERGGLCPSRELVRALRHEHVQTHGQVDDEGQRADQDHRLQAVIREVAPDQIEDPAQGPRPTS